MKKVSKIIYNFEMINTMIYIILIAFSVVNNKFQNYYSYIYICMSYLLIILNMKYNSWKILKKDIFMIFLYGIIVIINTFFSKYSIMGAISNYLLIIIQYIFYLNSENIKRNNIKYKNFSILYVLEWLICIFLYVLLFLFLVKNNPIYCNIKPMIIFLLFVFFYKRNNKLGVLVTIIYNLIVQKRLLFLDYIIFILAEFIISKYDSQKFKINIKRKKTFVFLIIIISNVIMVLLSYYMVYFIPVSNITSHHESLYDSSNAIRVRSNVYGINQILNDKYFIYSGYDNDIMSIMDVDDIENSPKFMLYRLVQPHNYLVNYILRFGVLNFVFYTFLISLIISNKLSKDNISLLICYAISNLFMHSLLTTGYLVIFMFVLNTEKKLERKVLK